MIVPTADDQSKRSADASAPPKVHLGYLDSMRALAAVYVVFYHAPLFVQREGTLTGPIGLLHSLLSYGYYAVCVFIVLSGFCLMLPIVQGDGFLRGGALHFFKKRARRILPPYYLALGISLFLIWLCLGEKTQTNWQNAVPVTFYGLLSHLLLLQDLSEKTKTQIDGPLWSVSVEWRIYFIFPLLVLLWRRIGPFATTLGTVIVAYTMLALLRQSSFWATSGGMSPEFLGLFGLGTLGAGITYSRDGVLRRIREKVPWKPAAAAASVILFLLTNLKHHHGTPIHPSILSIFVGIWAVIVLIAAGSDHNSLLHRALSWRPLAFLGTFAYSIYLIHGPVLQLFWLFVIVPLHLSSRGILLAEALGVVPATVAVAYLFFLACERPFLTRRVVLNTT